MRRRRDFGCIAQRTRSRNYYVRFNYPCVRVRGEARALHAFVMVLSHSRKPAVV